MSEEMRFMLTLAIGFGMACIFGYAAQRLKLSPIVGYLLAGYLIGPNFPGFVADPHISDQLATVGVTLLMFVVGLNFNWHDLIAVKKIALPGAIFLSTFSILAGLFYSMASGLSVRAGIVVGLAICVSSTVVIVRVLTDARLAKTVEGHLIIGWTIVEDLISILGLILLPVLVAPSFDENSTFLKFFYAVAVIALKTLTLFLIFYFVGNKVVEKLLKGIARTRSHELFTLGVLSCVFFIALGSSYLFGMSLALGAFIAGTVVGRTDVSHQAAANALPMKDAFSVLFFLSVGMLFNPVVIGNHLALFFGILAIIIFLRPLIALTIMSATRHSLNVSFTLAIAIGQIGEYSFIIAEEGNRLQILPDQGYDILVACAFVSIAWNSFLFQMRNTAGLEKMKSLFFGKKSRHHKLESPKISDQDNRAIVVGYGPIGQAVTHYLIKKEMEVIVIDQNIDTIASLRRKKFHRLFGDASQRSILESAKLESSKLLIITIPEFSMVQTIIQTARSLNSSIKIIGRSHFRSELYLQDVKNIPVVCDEDAAAEKIMAILDEMFG